ncbi:MAG: hypothetical protein WB799_17395 [Candidatus Sulfotelmatobacter sp.]
MSRKNDNPHRGKSDSENQRGISWPVKAILVFLALLVGLFDHALGGWGELVALAAAAVVVPVLLRQFRRFWSMGRFWLTVSLLAIVQVPLVIAIRPWVDQHGRSSTLLFVVVDVMFVGGMILWVCSKSSPD